MTILDKLMGDYTHAVHYIDGDTQKQYRCKAENAKDALTKCQWEIGMPLQSCAIITKEDNE
jgi:hypothetical protein